MTSWSQGDSPEGLDDQQSQALERAILGTSQQMTAVIDSDRWATRQGRADLLADVRKRMEATSDMIGEWLATHGR